MNSIFKKFAKTKALPIIPMEQCDTNAQSDIYSGSEKGGDILSTQEKLLTSAKAAEYLEISISAFRRKLLKAREEGAVLPEVFRIDLPETGGRCYGYTTEFLDSLDAWHNSKVHKISSDGYITPSSTCEYLTSSTILKPHDVTSKGQYEKSVFLSDMHVPFQDKEAITTAYNFIKWFQPDRVWLLGDIIDFQQISRFDTDPSRLLTIQEDLDDTKDILAELRKVSPNSIITYLEGNHEERLVRYCWTHPAIANLKALTLPTLLDLDKLNITYNGHLDQIVYNDFAIEHGDIIRQESAYTAKAQMDRRGISGITGHSHRLGTYYKTNMGGDAIWLENGCLCSRKPTYTHLPNWQQGFSVMHMNNTTGRFSLEQVVITGGKALYGGREFSA